MNKLKKNDINIDIYFITEEELFNREQINTLEDILRRKLPVWSKNLKILPTENAPFIGLLSDYSNLFEALQHTCPTRRGGLGNAILHGGYKGIYFYLDSSKQRFSTNYNGISVEILKILEIEGRDVVEWIFDFFSEVVMRLPIRYGRACLTNEFMEKNSIDPSVGFGVRGVNIYKSLPGIYWLNYLGIPYIKMIGKEKILNDSNAHIVKEFNGGVLLSLDKNPFEWSNGDYKKRELDIITNIGCKYFFLKDKADEETIAPDFVAEYKSRKN
jgi:hypothetical protein